MDDENIIIAVTDMELTAKALPSMVEWLRKLDGRLSVTLLYVEDACGMEAAIPVLEGMRTKDAQLAKLAKEFAYHGITAKSKAKVGVPTDEIISEARSTGAFAILMSTVARSGISRVLFSSMVRDVIKRSPCPVVVFKPRLLRFTEKIGVALSSKIKKLRGNAALHKR